MSTEFDRFPPGRPRVGNRLRRTLDRLVAPVRFVAFWLAVCMPAAYVPALLDGVSASRPGEPLLFVCLHALLFVLGHDYGRSGVRVSD
jgi:uncharacterized RDD family membrane protein YckC